MEINGVKVKAIRLVTSDEYLELSDYVTKPDGDIYCIEFDDGSVIYPGSSCRICMKNNLCMFNTLKYVKQPINKITDLFS